MSTRVTKEKESHIEQKCSHLLLRFSNLYLSFFTPPASIILESKNRRIHGGGIKINPARQNQGRLWWLGIGVKELSFVQHVSTGGREVIFFFMELIA